MFHENLVQSSTRQKDFGCFFGSLISKGVDVQLHSFYYYILPDCIDFSAWSSIHTMEIETTVLKEMRAEVVLKMRKWRKEEELRRGTTDGHLYMWNK